MGNVLQSDASRYRTSGIIHSGGEQRRKGLRSIKRSSSNRKPIEITLSYHSNSCYSSDNESPRSPRNVSRRFRSRSSSNLYSSPHAASSSCSAGFRISNILTKHSSSVKLLNTELAQSFVHYLSYFKPHILSSEDYLWPKEWNIPSYRNFYNLLVNYTLDAIGESSHLPSESFILSRLYGAYNYFIESLCSYLNSVAYESTPASKLLVKSNNELKRILDFSEIDDDFVSVGRSYKKQRLAFNVDEDLVKNSQFKGLFSKFTRANTANTFKISQAGVSALTRLHKMIMALSLNYQIYNQLTNSIKSVKDGLFSLKFAPSFPSPYLLHLPQLPQLPQFNMICPRVPYMSSIPSIRIIPYIASMAKMGSIPTTFNANSSGEDGTLKFESSTNEMEMRFKEHIATHTSHWGEEDYDHVEVTFYPKNCINGFKIPDTCTIM